MSLRSITDYMKRLDFTPQKPIKRTYQLNPNLIKKWLEEDYPKIKKKAKKSKSEIHWLDETKISSTSNYFRGFSPNGKIPIIKMKAKYLSFNIISTVTNRGKMRFMSYKNSLNSKPAH